jgi:hypothetical protein
LSAFHTLVCCSSRKFNPFNEINLPIQIALSDYLKVSNLLINEHMKPLGLKSMLVDRLEKLKNQMA